MSDLTPKENTALDIAVTRLGELVDRMEKATHPYPRERTWPDCEAEIERLRGCIVKMQVAAQISDWETFDAVYRAALSDAHR